MSSPKRVLLAAPRGYCAGVDRAVVTVERALDTYGPPVYVRKQIVHNRHVVEDLEARGAVFVEELSEVPSGSTVVFSAHGVSPEVHREASARGLKTIDATCPLVTKVHKEASRFAADDVEILLIGHAGHEEVEGTTGEAPEHITLVQHPDDVDAVEVKDPTKVAWLSQTTLSVDETYETVTRLREKFAQILGRPLPVVKEKSKPAADPLTGTNVDDRDEPSGERYRAPAHHGVSRHGLRPFPVGRYAG